MSRYLIVVFGFLTGCAFYRPQPLSPEKTAAQLESRRLDDPALKKYLEQNLGRSVPDWPVKTWDLDTLTLAAFYFHPGLEVARDQWLAANAGVKTARARPNPTVSVAPGYNSTTKIPTPWMLDATLDLPVETMGKRSKRTAAAKHAAESARYDFIGTAWKVRSELRADLLQATVTGQRADLLEKQFAAQEQVVKLLQQRLEAGEISQPELIAARMALNKSQLDLADARSARVEAHSRLAEAIGVTTAALDGVDLPFDFSQRASEELSADQARKTALLSRPDILGALADYAEAEDNLRLEIAKQYPDIHLGPGYQYDQGDNKWSLGVTLELPLLNHNGGPVAEAKAKRKLVAAKFVELQSRVIGEIDRAVAGYQVAGQQLQTADALYESSRKQYNFAVAQVAAGSADAVDQAGAEAEFANAALARLDNQARFQAALGALEDALEQPAGAIAATIDKLSEARKEP